MSFLPYTNKMELQAKLNAAYDRIKAAEADRDAWQRRAIEAASRNADLVEMANGNFDGVVQADTEIHRLSDENRALKRRATEAEAAAAAMREATLKRAIQQIDADIMNGESESYSRCKLCRRVGEHGSEPVHGKDCPLALPAGRALAERVRLLDRVAGAARHLKEWNEGGRIDSSEFELILGVLGDRVALLDARRDGGGT